LPSRRKLVAGNWKMHGSVASAKALAQGVAEGIASFDTIDVVVCPVGIHLSLVSDTLAGTMVQLGVQNAHAADNGAYTGEVAHAMLTELGCRYAILGHSERRQLFGETDASVAEKVQSALQHGITPILCVGETLEQREADELETVIHTQLGVVLAQVGIASFREIVVAYEPVWAIGTGKTASPDQAQEVHAMIRARLASDDADVAQGVRILYGGSVKPANANDLFSQADIDGGLIGGAALDASSFVAICQAAAAG